LGDPLENKNLEVYFLFQMSLFSFWVLLYGATRLHVDPWAFSWQKVHPVLIFDGWEHCQIRKGLSQNHLISLQKHRLHGPPAAEDRRHQSICHGFSLL
jgi:hypothetical protein